MKDIQSLYSTFYGYEHSLFYPYDSFLLLIFYFTLILHFTPSLQSAVCILPSVCILASVCSLRFTLTGFQIPSAYVVWTPPESHVPAVYHKNVLLEYKTSETISDSAECIYGSDTEVT